MDGVAAHGWYAGGRQQQRISVIGLAQVGERASRNDENETCLVQCVLRPLDEREAAVVMVVERVVASIFLFPLSHVCCQYLASQQHPL